MEGVNTAGVYEGLYWSQGIPVLVGTDSGWQDPESTRKTGSDGARTEDINTQRNGRDATEETDKGRREGEKVGRSSSESSGLSVSGDWTAGVPTGSVSPRCNNEGTGACDRASGSDALKFPGKLHT